MAMQWVRCAFGISAAVALAGLGGCAHAGRSTAPAAAATSSVIAGPLATPEMFDEIAEQDRNLFDLVFVRCDADALARMLTDDFEFYHDKFGQIASSPQQFVENVRSGCEAQAKGADIRARRELIPGTMAVYPMHNYGAIQTGSHRFFGLEPGKPDKLRESGRFFHLWKKVDGTWKLSRVFSFDHHPAE